MSELSPGGRPEKPEQLPERWSPRLSPRRFSRLLRVLGLTALLLLAALGYGLWVALSGHGLPCLFHRITGWLCPGCGMSRVMGALLRPDLPAAFSYNLLWPLYGGYVLFVFLSAAIPYVRHGKANLSPRPQWVHWVVLGVVLIYGVLRNLPGYNC